MSEPVSRQVKTFSSSITCRLNSEGTWVPLPGGINIDEQINSWALHTGSVIISVSPYAIDTREDDTIITDYIYVVVYETQESFRRSIDRISQANVEPRQQCVKKIISSPPRTAVTQPEPVNDSTDFLPGLKHVGDFKGLATKV